jgi:hypothetical protein
MPPNAPVIPNEESGSERKRLFARRGRDLHAKGCYKINLRTVSLHKEVNLVTYTLCCQLITYSLLIKKY